MIIKTYSAAAVMIVIGGLVVASYFNLVALSHAKHSRCLSTDAVAFVQI
jgi:hypothetical protein